MTGEPRGVPCARDAPVIDWIGLAAAGVLGGTLVLAFTRAHGPACISYSVFHIPCPGCGLTRSLVDVWRGDLLSSFRFHPLGIPMFVLCALRTLHAALRGPLKHRLAGIERLVLRLSNTPGAFGVLGVLLGVYAIRIGLYLAGNRFFHW